MTRMEAYLCTPPWSRLLRLLHLIMKEPSLSLRLTKRRRLFVLLRTLEVLKTLSLRHPMSLSQFPRALTLSDQHFHSLHPVELDLLVSETEIPNLWAGIGLPP